MAKAEQTPSTQEKSLNKRERGKLINYAADHIRRVTTKEKPDGPLIFKPEWPKLEPYVELFGMMGILRGDSDLSLSKQSHLRKMIAIQTTFTPQRRITFEAPVFLEEVKKETADEIAYVKTWPEDFEIALPKAWSNAFSDVLQLQINLWGRPG